MKNKDDLIGRFKQHNPNPRKFASYLKLNFVFINRSIK